MSLPSLKCVWTGLKQFEMLDIDCALYLVVAKTNKNNTYPTTHKAWRRACLTPGRATREADADGSRPAAAWDSPARDEDIMARKCVPLHATLLTLLTCRRWHVCTFDLGWRTGTPTPSHKKAIIVLRTPPSNHRPLVCASNQILGDSGGTQGLMGVSLPNVCCSLRGGSTLLYLAVSKNTYHKGRAKSTNHQRQPTRS
ncbi:hypothetical protein THAOC_33442 [Thalassiosira oceanica]|uniref:Uncharacterized protein n=1 Tax=Thalassiosira oceanica TaxID=159749 RepID=K0R461_THAOC|nr:hypothetical protein THAOC_33442 [Thalassiosira oceanica]|eukprot:EJK47818.1 hypothetical protein THAOC_33442 [Thalassiosira oceanica]